jgi:hypothetical protein
MVLNPGCRDTGGNFLKIFMSRFHLRSSDSELGMGADICVLKNVQGEISTLNDW